MVITSASFVAVLLIFFASSLAASSSVFALVVSCVRWFFANSMSSSACCFSDTASRYSSGSSTLVSCRETALAYTPPAPSPSGPSSLILSFDSISLWMMPRLF